MYGVLFALIGVLVLSPSVILADTKPPFWTEKSSFVEGETLYVVGISTRAKTLEQGRQWAYDHGIKELSNYTQIRDISGLTIETQMTKEEINPNQSNTT